MVIPIKTNTNPAPPNKIDSFIVLYNIYIYIDVSYPYIFRLDSQMKWLYVIPQDPRPAVADYHS